MRSFFKLVQIPPPRIISISTNLSKTELLNKLASQTVNKTRVFGKPPKFFGEVKNIEFEIFYTNTGHHSSRLEIVTPVKLRGISFDEDQQKFKLEIIFNKFQGTLLRFSNRFLIFWWLIWALLTLLIYPPLLMEEGTPFTALILCPLGVVFPPFCWHQLRKIPSSSLDYAQSYLTEFLRT